MESEFVIPGMTQAQFEPACEEARCELVLYVMCNPEPHDPLDVWQAAFWAGMRTAHFDRLSHDG